MLLFSLPLCGGGGEPADGSQYYFVSMRKKVGVKDHSSLVKCRCFDFLVSSFQIKQQQFKKKPSKYSLLEAEQLSMHLSITAFSCKMGARPLPSAGRNSTGCTYIQEVAEIQLQGGQRKGVKENAEYRGEGSSLPRSPDQEKKARRGERYRLPARHSNVEFS